MQLSHPSATPSDTAPFEAIKAIPPIGPLEQVSDAQLSRYADLIYARTGIRVSPQKKMLLSNRLRRRLRQTQTADFEAYYQRLKKLPPSDPEWDAFLQEITTHETYLFRDEAQWDWFRNDFLAQQTEAKQNLREKRPLRIWSAACSTGDEPTTIACCIAASLANLSLWQVEILATDIGTGALEQARSAVFGERAMHLVPAELKQRFFTKARDAAVWQAKPLLTGMIRYQQHNLMQPLRAKAFDLVFVKNVLIYFDAVSKKTVLEHVRGAVAPGGLLVAGAAEGVGELLKGFTRVQPWLYRKPA